MGKKAITQLFSLSIDPPRCKGEGKDKTLETSANSLQLTAPPTHYFTLFTGKTLVIPSTSFS